MPLGFAVHHLRCCRRSCCSFRYYYYYFTSIYDSIHTNMQSIHKLQMKLYCVRCNLFVHSAPTILPGILYSALGVCVIELRWKFRKSRNCAHPKICKNRVCVCVIFPVDTISFCSCGSRNFWFLRSNVRRLTSIGAEQETCSDPKRNEQKK